jgi:hypothetical protein
MAKKKQDVQAAEEARARRQRRSPEQMIADLQAKIAEIEQRAAAKQVKKSPAAKASLQAVRLLDKAMDLAAGEGETPLRHALNDARKPLAAFLESQGLRLPKARTPRGRRPKSMES